MSLFRKFSTLCPTPGQPLNACFAELLDITTELASSKEAVSDMALKNHIYTTLPSAYAVTIEILQSRAKVTVQEVIDALNECKTNRSMTTKPDAVSEALYTQQCGRGGRGGYQREMSFLRSDGVICVKQDPTLPPTAGARRTNEPEIRMTATIAEKKAI